MTGPGATHSRTTYNTHTRTHLCMGGHRRALHLHIPQFNLFLLPSHDSYCLTCSHRIIRSGSSVSLAAVGIFTKDNKHNNTRQINSAPISEASHLIDIAPLPSPGLQYQGSMMVKLIHLHCRGNLILRIFSFGE